MMNIVKTAGIIIIGNEILSGKVQDVNSHFIACELRELGVDVRRISVIADEVELIGEEAVLFSKKYDYVFTSGGVGPTHDDVTMSGIASGFGVKLIKHPDIREILHSRYHDIASGAVIKMSMVPDGSEVLFLENMRFPIVFFKNIYIFPGIPEYVRNKFTAIKERFRSPVFHLRRLYLNCHESNIADILSKVVGEHSDVTFGSYPMPGKPDYRIIITAECKSEELLNKALESLLNILPKEVLVKSE
jgi:molybdenum cofactor synthesis domain-containing protein